MRKSHGNNPMARGMCACCDDGSTFTAAAASRRRFLKAGAALAAGAAAPMLPTIALAQNAGADPELARLQGGRILLKGGVVLTMDRQLGDFAKADVLIEDGRIREIRPNITVSDDTAAVVDATNRILIPGFIDTHSHSYQGLLRSILNSSLLPDYNRDVQTTLTPAYEAARCLYRHAGDGARHDRHGHHRCGRHLADAPHARAQRRHHQARCRKPASAWSFRYSRAPGRRSNTRRTSSGCSAPISTPRTSCRHWP